MWHHAGMGCVRQLTEQKYGFNNMLTIMTFSVIHKFLGVGDAEMDEEGESAAKGWIGCV